jgi:hypothetical protein
MDSRTNAQPQVDELFDAPAEVTWDAYSVWRERVHKARGAQPQVPAPQPLNPGWDPYFVWLSRVRKAND